MRERARRLVLGAVFAVPVLGFVAWLSCVPLLRAYLHGAEGAVGIRAAILHVRAFGGDRGVDVIDEFAAARPDVAFDREHGHFFVYDPLEHTVLRDSFEPEVVADRGDPELDRAIVAATPSVYRRTHLPPGPFVEIRAVEEEWGPLYVVVTDSEGPLMGIRCYEGGWSVHDVDPATLEVVRASGTGDSAAE